MKQISTLAHFFFFLKANLFQTRKIIFRGHSLAGYKLEPGIGRINQAEIDKPFTIEEEKKMINSYINPYLEKGLVSIESMALAQHHGLPTRLLDWTWNPLVAFYFAVENDEHFERDGAIFFMKTKGIRFINPLDRISNDSEFDPFDIEAQTVLYEPKFISPRITAQSGLFSIHPNPNKTVKDSRIQNIIISKKIKGEIGVALETMGIHSANLFPGLDGESKHVKWLYSY